MKKDDLVIGVYVIVVLAIADLNIAEVYLRPP